MTDMTPAERIAQQAAEYLYSCATCEDNRVASSQTELYRAAEYAYREAMRTAFGLDAAELDAAREILSAYGPHDGAYGTPYSSDVRGHAIVARHDAAERIAEAAERQVYRDHTCQDEELSEWDVYRHGERVYGAYLTDGQVGHYFRQLPGGVRGGWGFRPVADGPAPDDVELSRVESSACER